MKKSSLQLIDDAAAFVLLAAMVSTGLVLEFILEPGAKRRFRGGFGADDASDSLLGFSRHDWGELHFYLACGFVFVLLVHLILHWNWIVAMAQRGPSGMAQRGPSSKAERGPSGMTQRGSSNKAQRGSSSKAENQRSLLLRALLLLSGGLAAALVIAPLLKIAGVL